MVSGADARYFPLMQELFASARRFAGPRHAEFATTGSFTYSLAFGAINAGLTGAQVAMLKTEGVTCVEGHWPTEAARKRAGAKTHLVACVSRPFIPKLFPGYDAYIWLDADTWVQSPEALDMLVAGALRQGLAIVPQVDRAYGRTVRLKWLGPLPYKPRSFYYSNARRAFGGRVARSLFPYPTLNAGVFALTADAPHWPAWQQGIVAALKRGKVFTAEQLSLGRLVWLDDFSVELLPATCNWLCMYLPLWDPARRCFVEPGVPHAPLGILHLTGFDALRLDPGIRTEVPTTDGGTEMRSLRFQESMD